MSETSKKPLTKCTATVLLLMITVLLIPSPGSANSDDDPPVALPGCQDRCGDFIVPYPFGIGDNCSHNSWFTIECSRFNNQPLLTSLTWSKLQLVRKPYHQHSFAEKGSPVTQISLATNDTDYGTTVSISGSWDQLLTSGAGLYGVKNLNLTGMPYLLMGARNALLVGGCSGGAVFIRNMQNDTVAGCATVCVDSTSKTQSEVGSCYGLGCCQSAIPTSLDFVEMDFVNLRPPQNITDLEVSAAVIDLSYIANSNLSDTTLTQFQDAPTVLQWRIMDLDVSSTVYSNSSCIKNNDGSFSCRCKYDYYHGNPYLPNGCRARKECEKCIDDCIAIDQNKFGCPIRALPPPSKSAARKIVLGLSISLGSILVFLCLVGLYILFKRRKDVIKRVQNFKRNGGLLLQQQLSASEGAVERNKIFSQMELEKATDNFNDTRVLGRGGQGTVYKGMLEDGTIVAVKKSKKVGENHLAQFINEVVILSQINHRNIVKLFGCCLETEVPMLVYEFVPNGTLYQHIHNSTEDFYINWKMRLQIAGECAAALAYLHSSSSSPVYHRDIKSSNILLDEKYKAKISDFGTSKTVSIDQTHVTTCVQGTFGYLDPEFFQSSQFTEKSDVYSFGVVLLELLSSKKPILADTSKESRSLATEFLQLMESTPDKLHHILDSQVSQECTQVELEALAKLIKQCLSLNGKQRPTMKEVAMTLDMIRSQHDQAAAKPPIEQSSKRQEVQQWWTDQMSVTSYEGPFSTTNTSASADESYSVDAKPLLFNF